ncbi:MAG: FHA domain-containing protein [Gammaproteobacteria bacterium]
MTRILINRGSFRVKELELEHGTITIGRDADNDVCIQDKTVSSHHAKIVTVFNATYVEDGGSTNGTYVNGKRINRHTLRTGDVIAIGNHQILFESDAEESAVPSGHTTVLDRKQLDALLAERPQPRSTNLGVAKSAGPQPRPASTASGPAPETAPATPQAAAAARVDKPAAPPKPAASAQAPGGAAPPRSAPRREPLSAAAQRRQPHTAAFDEDEIQVPLFPRWFTLVGAIVLIAAIIAAIVLL